MKLSGLSCLDSGTSGCSMDPLVISRTVVCSRAYVNLFIWSLIFILKLSLSYTNFVAWNGTRVRELYCEQPHGVHVFRTD